MSTRIRGDATYGNSEIEISYWYDAAGRVVDQSYPAVVASGGALNREIVRTTWNEFGQPTRLSVLGSTGAELRTIIDEARYDIYG